jgi:hypothetical protein
MLSLLILLSLIVATPLHARETFSADYITKLTQMATEKKHK